MAADLLTSFSCFKIFSGNQVPVPAARLREERKGQPDSGRAQHPTKLGQGPGGNIRSTQMSKEVFEELKTAMADAIAFAKGDASRGRVVYPRPMTPRGDQGRSKGAQAHATRVCSRLSRRPRNDPSLGTWRPNPRGPGTGSSARHPARTGRGPASIEV